jgi:signal transduction histidine kinase
MKTDLFSVGETGPFRLLKYFIVSGFVVIISVTITLAAILYSKSVDTLLKGAEDYARLLAENLNYNIYNGFYAPLRARGLAMDLRDWEQFGALDSLVKDFTYGLKIQRIKITDRDRKIVYCTDYELIGTYDPKSRAFERTIADRDVTEVHYEKDPDSFFGGKWLALTHYPLRELTGNHWMLGNIYGVMEISQDVTQQYVRVQRYIFVIILVSAALMAFLFVALTFIVRRGEKILLERAKERKRLEEKLQQSEKLASIGQMVATLAHEIRNPLGIIKSSAEMLGKKAGSDPERTKKFTGIIAEEAGRLSAVLTDFLDFAKPRNPQIANIDVRDVLSQVRLHLEQESAARGIEWNVETDNGSSAVVAGDAHLLYQAFLNMAMNAFEAMKTGGALSIRVARENGAVRIEFHDTGHGIKEEDLGKIFTPFFTTHEMGTGLGLSVVHNIITAHGGDVRAESVLGKGSVFTVILPSGREEAELKET